MHPLVAASLVNSLSHERVAAATARRAAERSTRAPRRSLARLHIPRPRTP
jgi:hypothetical protein